MTRSAVVMCETAPASDAAGGSIAITETTRPRLAACATIMITPREQ